MSFLLKYIYKLDIALERENALILRSYFESKVYVPDYMISNCIKEKRLMSLLLLVSYDYVGVEQVIDVQRDGKNIRDICVLYGTIREFKKLISNGIKFHELHTIYLRNPTVIPYLLRFSDVGNSYLFDACCAKRDYKTLLKVVKHPTYYCIEYQKELLYYYNFLSESQRNKILSYMDAKKKKEIVKQEFQYNCLNISTISGTDIKYLLPEWSIKIGDWMFELKDFEKQDLSKKVLNPYTKTPIPDNIRLDIKKKLTYYKNRGISILFGDGENPRSTDMRYSFSLLLGDKVFDRDYLRNLLLKLSENGLVNNKYINERNMILYLYLTVLATNIS